MSASQMNVRSDEIGSCTYGQNQCAPVGFRATAPSASAATRTAWCSKLRATAGRKCDPPTSTVSPSDEVPRGILDDQVKQRIVRARDRPTQRCLLRLAAFKRCQVGSLIEKIASEGHAILRFWRGNSDSATKSTDANIGTFKRAARSRNAVEIFWIRFPNASDGVVKLGSSSSLSTTLEPTRPEEAGGSAQLLDESRASTPVGSGCSLQLEGRRWLL